MNKTIVLITSLLFLPFPTFAVETSSHTVSQAAVETSNCEIKAENGDTGEYSDKQLETLAKRITVRVIGDNNGGSGTLLAKKGNTYLVITNSHVVRGVNSISLQMSDGKTYSAQILPNTNFDKFDLALLEFKTNQNYCLLEPFQAIPDTDTQVLAAGYSSEKGEIVFRTGIVKQIFQLALKEGYSIGYSSDIEQGMSGGAIVNSVGQIIGINGRSAYPILNTGYVYPDGSPLTNEEIQQMRKLSWGIPISTFLAQVNNQILTAYSLPLPKLKPEQSYTVPATRLTGWLGELAQKAKQITVRIDSSSKANGSGIIIAKNGDTYTVLTAAHVVCERGDATQACHNYNYQILAPDDKQYLVDKSTIKTESGVDLAVVKFTAPHQNYQVATLANYNPKNFDYMFTSGYPKQGDNYSPWRLTMGIIFDKEQGRIQSKEPDLQTDSSSKSQTASSLTGGYELVYTSISYGGMSGGAVLDSQGRVIGIHGRAEGEQAFDEKTGDMGSSDRQVQIGYSLGIPVSTFLGLATRLGVQPQKVETTAAPQLNTQQIKSIEEAILSTDISTGNTTASQWIERGNQLWRLLRVEEAVKAFDEAIKLNPSFVYLAYYGKGLALYWNRKYQESIPEFELTTKLKPDFVAAWLYLSEVYRLFKQPDKALVTIQKAISLQPKNPNLYNQKYLVLEDLKRYAEAETAINKAIELNPHAAFYDNRGNHYADRKKWDLALANFNQALAINPQSAEAYNNRGTLHADQKKWDLALADFNNAIAFNPKYAEAYINRGNLFSDLKKWELAEADFSQAIAINSQYANAYVDRGLFYREQKKWELAEADFSKAITINPQYANAYNNRGILYYDLQKWELAEADFTKAIAINTQDANAYINRGNLYYDLQKWDLALTDYNQAIVINPQDAEVFYNRGNLYSQLQKWDLALTDYNKSIAINPQYADAYNNRGNLYSQLQKWDLALANFNKAITINPEYAPAYNNRGNLYTVLQKLDLALADFTKAIAINPQSANAYAGIGVVYLQKGDTQKAIKDLQQAAQLFYAQGNTAAYEVVINLLKQLQR
ncbi:MULTISPECIES: tetratricopeptide repeat protein [Nostoc]|uniref:Tetratricopeptide repeat protein n=1 Tax=Nostoc paludosum FACHB-159 TaxID=2692908 RepID=A0ABR8KF78_9NOSO|nr:MULTISPECIES: tetratricopeptide repeat protein [Nostoc]MBD2680925.1 tetratricopeptide repeat protein [Nostoc sp. FACHB-857]MBD2737401.1 tetratricopeptide repeat protein [Nostoc paludosum FACHB-159]